MFDSGSECSQGVLEVGQEQAGKGFREEPPGFDMQPVFGAKAAVCRG